MMGTTLLGVFSLLKEKIYIKQHQQLGQLKKKPLKPAEWSVEIQLWKTGRYVQERRGHNTMGSPRVENPDQTVSPRDPVSS